MHSLRIEKTPGLNSNDAIGLALELNLIKRFLVTFKPNQAKHSDWWTFSEWGCTFVNSTRLAKGAAKELTQKILQWYNIQLYSKKN